MAAAVVFASAASCVEENAGSPDPTRKTWSAYDPPFTRVVKRVEAPKTARASVAVTSLVLEAGMRALEPFLDQTVAPLAASTTAPEKTVPNRVVVTLAVSLLAMRRSAAEAV